MGAMIPSAILLPKFQLPLSTLTLNSSWQIPALLLCALVCGPRSSVISAVAYLTIGIFFLPVFQGGGSIGYLLTPEFGYLIGFIPASWISGQAAQNVERNNLISLFLAAIYGVIAIQLIGTINLIIGTTLSYSPEPLESLIFKYTLVPLLAQIILCPSIALIALIMRKSLLIK